MITERDLQEAIAECEGVRNPNANTAIKLAAFYIIRREMFGAPEQTPALPAYSNAAPPDTSETPIIKQSGDGPAVGDYGDSDFLRAIAGKDPAEVWPIMDEMMETLRMLNERLYNNVMRRIR